MGGTSITKHTKVSIPFRGTTDPNIDNYKKIYINEILNVPLDSLMIVNLFYS